MGRRFSNLWVYLWVCIAFPLALLPGDGPRRKRIIKDEEEIELVFSPDSSEIFVIESESEEAKSSLLGQIMEFVEGIGSLFSPKEDS